MRIGLIFVCLTLALIGVGVAAFALFQPNPSGDFVTGMAHLVISAMGAAGALFCAVIAAVLRFTRLATHWVLLGAAAVLVVLYGALAVL